MCCQRLHIVFPIDGVNVAIQAQLGVVNNVQKLFAWPYPPCKSGMSDHAYSAADKLVEFAEAPVRAHRHNNGNRREVITLAKHLQLHYTLQVARFLFESLSDSPDPSFGHRVMKVGARNVILLSDAG